jgi:hypothetical protein
MERPKVVIEEITDPAEVARRRPAREAFGRNTAWLQAHWPELLPQALGKHVAVSGEQAFIADTAAEAIALAKAAHPDDPGLLVQYVRPEKGPRFYGNRG